MGLNWQWSPPPAVVTLGKRDVHVWAASLDAPRTTLQQCRSVLSTDELGRSERFFFERDQKRFAIGRGLLRRILGNYLNRSPAEVEFGYNHRGKPRLADATSRLRFNLAHSQELVVYAVALDREVGIDVEAIRVIGDMEEIARRFFAPGEVAQLFSMQRDCRADGFFNCWTRKEAYLKARGDGIGDALTQFEVTLLPDHQAALVRHELLQSEPNRWTFYDLRPASGYAGALAVEGNDHAVQCWQLSEDVTHVLSER